MYKVLLVDDEMPALRFLQTIIEKFARELTIAQSCLSGEAALAFLRENKVNLLITDISMSGMDGNRPRPRRARFAAGDTHRHRHRLRGI